MSYLLDEDTDGELFDLPENEVAAADFIALLGRKYQAAFLQRKVECKLTQQGLALSLGVNRSRIHRLLSGHSNMTAETMAELAWALKAQIKFDLVLDELDEDEKSNYFVGAKLPVVTAVPRTENQVHVTAGLEPPPAVISNTRSANSSYPINLHILGGTK